MRAYRGEAADAEASRRRRDLDDLEGVLVLLLPLQLPVPVLLPAHHRQTRLHAADRKEHATCQLVHHSDRRTRSYVCSCATNLVVGDGGGGDHGHGGLLSLLCLLPLREIRRVLASEGGGARKGFGGRAERPQIFLLCSPLMDGG